MNAPRLLVWSSVWFVLSASASQAGPCSAEIDAMQARIDAKLEAKAAAGPVAKEGVMAGRSDQPTPRSMAAVEVKLGELPPRAVAAVEKAMAQARAADAAGDAKTCKKALAKVRSFLRH